MDLPDRKCVELDANQAVNIVYQVFSTREFPPSMAYPTVIKAERIVIHHDAAGHMVRIKLKDGWHEHVNQPYSVLPSDCYAPKAPVAGTIGAQGSPVFLTTNTTEPNQLLGQTLHAGTGISFTK